MKDAHFNDIPLVLEAIDASIWPDEIVLQKKLLANDCVQLVDSDFPGARLTDPLPWENCDDMFGCSPRK